MNEIIEYVGIIVRQVDSTLLDEWEKLKNSGAAPVQSSIVESMLPAEQFDITRNKRGFEIAIRNEVFQYIKALSYGRPQLIMDYCKAAHPEHKWSIDEIKKRLEEYKIDHQGPLTDRRSRSANLFQLNLDGVHARCDQMLCDEDGFNDWQLRFLVDIEASREAGRPIVKLQEFSSVSPS